MRDLPLRRGIALGIVILTLAVFTPVLRNGFVRFDDTHFILWNTHVLKGFTPDGLRWAFTSTEDANWFPLTRLGFMLNVELFGLRPWGHHATSAALHAASAGLLFLAFAGMTGALWRSALAAALFAVHPLRVESVAWASELPDVLSGFFFFLAVHLHTRAVRGGRRGDRAALVAATALGLMAKPMLVTLPFVLLLLDFWPLGRFISTPRTQLVREKAPLLALAAGIGLLTTYSQARIGAVGSLADFPLPVRFMNAAVAVAGYLGKLLWPLRLSPFYPHPGDSIGLWPVAASAALIAGTSLLAIACRRSRPWLAVGWAWYLLMLLPVSGLVQVGFQSMADRYTYLPLVGIGAAAAWELGRWYGARPAARATLLAGSAAFLLFLAVLTPGQAARWRDSRTLFQHALALEPGNWLAWLKLGEVARGERKPGEALPLLERAVAEAPWNVFARTLLGVTLGELGRSGDARRELEEAVRRGPSWVDARHNLAVILANDGRYADAARHLREELRLDPRSLRARQVLAPILFMAGEIEEAERVCNEWLAVEPGARDARDLQERIRAARALR